MQLAADEDPPTSAATQRQRHKVYIRRNTGAPASQKNGVYTPSESVRTYPYVYQGSSVDLTCTVCKGILKASWYAKCGATFQGMPRVICPKRHNNCCRNSRLAPPPEFARINDDLQSIAFCEHGKRMSRCMECGGEEFCEHKKMRFDCPICSSCEHGLLRSKCAVCKEVRKVQGPRK